MSTVELESYRAAVEYALRRGWLRPGPPPLSQAEVERALREAQEERKRLGLCQKRGKHA